MRLASAIGTAGPAPTRPPRRVHGHDPCGGETVLDLAVCLILAFAVVGLLLIAL